MIKNSFPVVSRLILALTLLPLNTMAAEGWALANEKSATRQVRITLSSKTKLVEQWVLPVAQNGPEVKDFIQTKWVTLSPAPSKNVPTKIFTDTWLGTIDANAVWVRYEWWPNQARNWSQRIENNFIVVPFRSTETVQMKYGLHIDVAYEPAP